MERKFREILMQLEKEDYLNFQTKLRQKPNA